MARYCSYLLTTYGMALAMLVYSGSLNSKVGAIEAKTKSCYLEDYYTLFNKMKNICLKSEAPEAFEGINQWPNIIEGDTENPRETEGNGELAEAIEVYKQIPTATTYKRQQNGKHTPEDAKDLLMSETDEVHEPIKITTFEGSKTARDVVRRVLGEKHWGWNLRGCERGVDKLIDVVENFEREQQLLVQAGDDNAQAFDDMLRKERDDWTLELWNYNEIFKLVESNLNEWTETVKSIAVTAINNLENDRYREKLKKAYLEEGRKFYIKEQQLATVKDATVDEAIFKVIELKCKNRPQLVHTSVKKHGGSDKAIWNTPKPPTLNEEPVDWFEEPQKSISQLEASDKVKELSLRNKELSELLHSRDQEIEKLRSMINEELFEWQSDIQDDAKQAEEANRKVDLKLSLTKLQQKDSATVKQENEVQQTVKEAACKQHGNWTSDVPQEYREMVEIKQKDLQQLWKAAEQNYFQNGLLEVVLQNCVVGQSETVRKDLYSYMILLYHKMMSPAYYLLRLLYDTDSPYVNYQEITDKATSQILSEMQQIVDSKHHQLEVDLKTCKTELETKEDHVDVLTENITVMTQSISEYDEKFSKLKSHAFRSQRGKFESVEKFEQFVYKDGSYDQYYDESSPSTKEGTVEKFEQFVYKEDLSSDQYYDLSSPEDSSRKQGTVEKFEQLVYKDLSSDQYYVSSSEDSSRKEGTVDKLEQLVYKDLSSDQYSDDSSPEDSSKKKKVPTATLR